MATVRKPATKPKAAVLKTTAELTHSIEILDAKLSELTAQQTVFSQNSYVSQKVYHKSFGEGVITEQHEDIIKVSFAESGLSKAFVIHQKFPNRPVFEQDEQTIAAFSDFADRRQLISQLEQEKIRLKKQCQEMVQK